MDSKNTAVLKVLNERYIFEKVHKVLNKINACIFIIIIIIIIIIFNPRKNEGGKKIRKVEIG